MSSAHSFVILPSVLYACEGDLEEHSLKVFENKILKRMFPFKGEKK
jgi:hypothetical protein